MVFNSSIGNLNEIHISQSDFPFCNRKQHVNSPFPYKKRMECSVLNMKCLLYTGSITLQFIICIRIFQFVFSCSVKKCWCYTENNFWTSNFVMLLPISVIDVRHIWCGMDTIWFAVEVLSFDKEY